MSKAAEILQDYGLRITPQRELIFRLLMGSKEHPTAEKIYQEVSEVFPSLSRNTVYKTLEALEAKGLVKRFNTGESADHYDANTAPHGHITCLKCRRVDDINGELSSIMDELDQKAESSSGYQVLSADLYFYGICPDCR